MPNKFYKNSGLFFSGIIYFVLLPSIYIQAAAVANRPPAISGIPPLKVIVGNTFSFTPTAKDPDNDPLTFSIANKPAWMSFDKVTGKLSGTPTVANIGVTTTGYVISVSDGKGGIAKLAAYNLVVIPAGTNGTANVAPVISGVPKLKINVGEEFKFTPTAKDANNDPLTFSIINKPVWANFNAANGSLSGIPTLANVGLSPKAYIISVSDNKGGRASLSAFNTLVVGSSPSLALTGSAPADGATSIPVASHITLSFNRAVRAGNGNIVISNGAGDVRTIAVTDTSQISFDGSKVTIKPSTDLNPATDYFVQISTGAIRDNAGVNFVGISNTTDINFTTGGALYATPLKGNASTNGTGTLADPYQSIGFASKQAQAGDSIYILTDGLGDISTGYTIEASRGTEISPITIKPAPGHRGLYSTTAFVGWRVLGSQHLIIEGFEFDGNSDRVDHWDLVSRGVWTQSTVQPMGGIAINISTGTNITIQNNYFHDLYQKAVNVEGPRYVTITHNIVHDVATKSLSGGHGIMRQQGAFSNFGTPDDAGKYRWDINGNLLFNIEQRIYSWVPSKGYMNMTLDEGKPILIDETTDRVMHARIANNVVAFAGIDAIRIKPTANLEVVNNSIYSSGEHSDGITDINTLKNISPFNTDPFPGLIVANNLVQTAAGSFAFELNDAFPSANADASRIFNNKVIGQINPAGLTGVTTASGDNLYVAPRLGDFTPLPGIDPSLGASTETLAQLETALATLGVNVAPSNWHNDHLRMMQTLLDNIPGLADGIAGNETIFKARGQWAVADTESGRYSYYFQVDPAWKTSKSVTNSVLNRNNNAYDGLYEIITPPEYSTWYIDKLAKYPGYGEIRYGTSTIAQNKVFASDGLHLVSIGGTIVGQYDSVSANGMTVTLDGDMRVVLDPAYVPKAGDTFDLINARVIVPVQLGIAFDNVFLPTLPTGLRWRLSIVDGASDILKLSILAQ